jgi:hypothetical protein
VALDRRPHEAEVLSRNPEGLIHQNQRAISISVNKMKAEPTHCPHSSQGGTSFVLLPTFGNVLYVVRNRAECHQRHYRWTVTWVVRLGEG